MLVCDVLELARMSGNSACDVMAASIAASAAGTSRCRECWSIVRVFFVGHGSAVAVVVDDLLEGANFRVDFVLVLFFAVQAVLVLVTLLLDALNFSEGVLDAGEELLAQGFELVKEGCLLATVVF